MSKDQITRIAAVLFAAVCVFIATHIWRTIGGFDGADDVSDDFANRPKEPAAATVEISRMHGRGVHPSSLNNDAEKSARILSERAAVLREEPVVFINRISVDPLDLAASRDTLMRESSEGDATASLRLSKLHEFCIDAAKDKKNLRERINSSFQTRKHDGRYIADFENWEQFQTVQYRICSQIGGGHVAAAHEYLTLAARQGSIEAQTFYVDSAPADSSNWSSRQIAEYRKEAVSFAERALSGGSIDAALRLSNFYTAGAVVEKDPLKALTYSLVAESILRDVPGYEWAIRRAAELKGAARSYEVQEAMDAANSILNEEPCCFLFSKGH